MIFGFLWYVSGVIPMIALYGVMRICQGLPILYGDFLMSALMGIAGPFAVSIHVIVEFVFGGQ